MRVVVTGGAGFIGSAVVRRLVRSGYHVLNVDKLTYAGRIETVAEVASLPGYGFARIDVTDKVAMTNAFRSFDPDCVFHLAAESHVDRSIEDATPFIATNVVGTYAVLECALTHWNSLNSGRRKEFRVIHVSTDEVYGTLGETGAFTEDSPYAPNSPYAASKAAADHFARAWHRTYGLPVIITNCSNNYGPWQHPEKLIPTILRHALAERPIPIYGRGTNVRDWLFVEDHVDGLLLTAREGVPGERYNFGGSAERANIDVARAICAALDRTKPRSDRRPHADCIQFVTDRPGHDFRYAIDAVKVRRELGWSPAHDFESAIAETVNWFLLNPIWLKRTESELGRRGLVSAPEN